MPRIRELATHPYPFVTVTEFADYLMVSEKTIRRQIEKGAIAVVRVGEAIRIPIQVARDFAKYPLIPEAPAAETADSRGPSGR